MYTEGLSKKQLADKCAILASLNDIQRISYHYSQNIKKTSECGLSV
jgi:hypothetical protein